MSPYVPFLLDGEVEKEGAENSRATVSSEGSGEELHPSPAVPPSLLSSSPGQAVKGNVNGKGCSEGIYSRIFIFSQREQKQ